MKKKSSSPKYLYAITETDENGGPIISKDLEKKTLFFESTEAALNVNYHTLATGKKPKFIKIAYKDDKRFTFVENINYAGKVYSANFDTKELIKKNGKAQIKSSYKKLADDSLNILQEPSAKNALKSSRKHAENSKTEINKKNSQKTIKPTVSLRMFDEKNKKIEEINSHFDLKEFEEALTSLERNKYGIFKKLVYIRDLNEDKLETHINNLSRKKYSSLSPKEQFLISIYKILKQIDDIKKIIHSIKKICNNNTDKFIKINITLFERIYLHLTNGEEIIDNYQKTIDDYKDINIFKTAIEKLKLNPKSFLVDSLNLTSNYLYIHYYLSGQEDTTKKIVLYNGYMAYENPLYVITDSENTQSTNKVILQIHSKNPEISAISYGDLGYSYKINVEDFFTYIYKAGLSPYSIGHNGVQAKTNIENGQKYLKNITNKKLIAKYNEIIGDNNSKLMTDPLSKLRISLRLILECKAIFEKNIMPLFPKKEQELIIELSKKEEVIDNINNGDTTIKFNKKRINLNDKSELISALNAKKLIDILTLNLESVTLISNVEVIKNELLDPKKSCNQNKKELIELFFKQLQSILSEKDHFLKILSSDEITSVFWLYNTLQRTPNIDKELYDKCINFIKKCVQKEEENDSEIKIFRNFNKIINGSTYNQESESKERLYEKSKNDADSSSEESDDASYTFKP